MIVNKEGRLITVVLDAPWEQEVSDWLWERYGDHMVKNLLSKLLYEKQRAKVAIEVKEEMERRLGTQR